MNQQFPRRWFPAPPVLLAFSAFLALLLATSCGGGGGVGDNSAESGGGEGTAGLVWDQVNWGETNQQ